MSNPFTTKDPLVDIIKQVVLGEKKLTDAELKKREEIVLAIKRENPDMEKSRAYAIATAQAKKVAEEVELDEAMKPFTDADHATADKHGTKIEKNIEHIKKVPTKHLQYLYHHNMGYSGGGGHEAPHLPHIKAELKKRGAKPLSHTEGEKVFNESFEQIDEISKKTLGNYVAKAVVDVHNDARWAGETDDKDAKNKAFKRLLGVKSAASRLSQQVVPGGRINHFRRNNEEVNLDEHLENFWEAYTTMFNEAEDQQQNILLRAMAKDPTDLMKMKRAIKMGDKALTNPALRQEILAMLDKMMNLTTADPSLLQRTKMGFQKAKKLNMPEEVQLEAIGAKDKQDEGEYGYEGDMAMSQLRTIIRNCQEMMKVLDKETDMPEWVQSKITLATDYLQTANDYLMSELEEAANPAQQAAIAIAMKKAGKKPKNEEVEKAPFEGGREVKSTKPAAERVKKIAKGMQKHYTKDKK
jgi:hypothetical protein